MWVAVHGFADGIDVNAENLNKPVHELAERTSYLYGRLNEMTGTPFESVRLFQVPLVADGALAPAVKDVVCLYQDLGAYGKAVASMDLIDEFAAAASAHAVGVLVAKSGSTGTVVIMGKLTMETGGAAWALADMLEQGQTFRPGPYYLSAVEAGKLTATPIGPSVYVGTLLERADMPGKGSYALLSPQYRDNGNSHIHRSFKLYAQPAGRHVIANADDDYPQGRDYIVGFSPISDSDTYAWVPRLTVYGDWTGPASVQYTIWLSTDTGTTRATSPVPESFDNCWLHWISSDPDEAQGKSRVLSFEAPVTLGSHGLSAVLENPGGVDVGSGVDWDIPYAGEGGGLDADKRTYQITVPEDTRGWLAHKTRGWFDAHAALDNKFSFVIMGGPYEGDQSSTVTAACAEIYRLDIAIPDNNSGISLTRGAVGDPVYFEFTDNMTVVHEGAIAVQRELTATATFRNLAAAILDLEDASVIPVFAEDAGYLFVGMPEASSVEVMSGDETWLATPVLPVSDGVGDIGTISPAVAGTAALLVYDQDYNTLVTEAPYFWNHPTFWQPQALGNGLYAMALPYSAAGVAYTSVGVSVGDYWERSITDTAPVAPFAYAMGMHQGLSACYPPVPAKTATLVVNGVELESSAFFDGAAYDVAPDTLYWYPDAAGSTPWPKTWQTRLEQGQEEDATNTVFHFVRNVIGATGYVASIRPAPGSPIKVTACGTADSATNGDLALDIDLTMNTVDSGLAGYKAVKSVASGKLELGPVVERIVAGAGVTLTQTSGAPSGQGVVTISMSAATYTGDFEEVALDNAKQEMIGLFPYIKLLGWNTGVGNIDTGFTAKFRVPHNLPNVPYRVVVYATVFGEDDVVGGEGIGLTYAGLKFTYAVLPDIYMIGSRPATSSLNPNLVDNLIVPDAVRDVAVPMGNVAATPYYRAYDPMLLQSDDGNEPTDVPGHKTSALGQPFPHESDMASPLAEMCVRPGSLVAVRFSRGNLPQGANLNEYTGPIGFIGLRWMLVTV